MQLISSILSLMLLAHYGIAVPILHSRRQVTIINRVTCQILGVRIADPVAVLSALEAGNIPSQIPTLSDNEFGELLRACINASSEKERNRFPTAEDYGLGADSSMDGAAPSTGDNNTASSGAARSNIASAGSTDATSNAAPVDTNNSANSSTASTDATTSAAADNNTSASTAPAGSGGNSSNNSANNSSPDPTTSNIAADSSTSASSSGSGSDNGNSDNSDNAGKVASAAPASGDTNTAAPANDSAPAVNNGDVPFNPDEAPADPYTGAGYAPFAAYAPAGDSSSPAPAPAPASDDAADAFLNNNRQQTVSENGCTGILCAAESMMGVGAAPELGMTGLTEGNPRGCPNGAVGACVDTK